MIFSWLAVYADNQTQYLGDNFHLDRSQDVYFEKFYPYLFSEQLLETKDNFDTRHVIIGGLGEFDAQTWNSMHLPDYDNGSGIFATQLIMDGMSNLNNWITVFVSPSESNLGQPNGSVFQWQRAFFLFGDLDKVPLYLTTGVNLIPFGVFFGAGPWDTPLTSNYFNLAQAPQIIAGLHISDFNLMTGWYNDEINNNNHALASVYYAATYGDFSYQLGTGFVTHINSNETMDANRYGGAMLKVPNSNLGNLGNVIDVNGNLSYKNITFLTEFDQGSRDVNNNKGKPSAYSLVGNYQDIFFHKMTTMGLGFSRTYDLKDVTTFLTGNGGLSPIINGLSYAWSCTLSRNISPTMIIGFDYQRARTYGFSDKNTGSNTNTYTLDLTTYL